MVTSLLAANVYALSPGRIAAIAAVVVGLIGAILGARSVSGRRRRDAVAALVLGPIGLVAGASVVATAGGGVGTGNGLGGGVVAMAIGVIGPALGALGLTRSRRVGG